MTYFIHSNNSLYLIGGNILCCLLIFQIFMYFPCTYVRYTRYVGAMDGSATGGPWGGVKGFGFGESLSLVSCHEDDMYKTQIFQSSLNLYYVMYDINHSYEIFYNIKLIMILECRSRSRYRGWCSNGCWWRCDR